MVSRGAHNAENAGSNPAPATNLKENTMKFVWLAVIVIGLLVAVVLAAATNKFNLDQLLSPGNSTNGFVIGVTPAGAVTFLGLGTGLSISGTTLNASGSTLNFADYVAVPGTPNGTTTTFTLANSPNPSTSLGVFKNGQLLQSGTGNDFTLSGAVITFAIAPLATDNLQASYRF